MVCFHNELRILVIPSDEVAKATEESRDPYRARS